MGTQPITRSVDVETHVDNVAEVHSVPMGETPLPSSKEAPKATSEKDELIVKKEHTIHKMKQSCGTKPAGEIVAALPCWTGTTTCTVNPGNKPSSTTAVIFSWEDAHVVIAGSSIPGTSASYCGFNRGRRCVYDHSRCWKEDERQTTVQWTYSDAVTQAMGIGYHVGDSVRIQGRLVRAPFDGHCLNRCGKAHPSHSKHTTECIETGLNGLWHIGYQLYCAEREALVIAGIRRIRHLGPTKDHP